jgi:hypothetical protein
VPAEIAVRQSQRVAQVGEVRTSGLGKDHDDAKPGTLVDHVV